MNPKCHSSLALGLLTCEHSTVLSLFLVLRLFYGTQQSNSLTQCQHTDKESQTVTVDLVDLFVKKLT